MALDPKRPWLRMLAVTAAFVAVPLLGACNDDGGDDDDDDDDDDGMGARPAAVLVVSQ
jgi:hypothetical protein